MRNGVIAVGLLVWIGAGAYLFGGATEVGSLTWWANVILFALLSVVGVSFQAVRTSSVLLMRRLVLASVILMPCIVVGFWVTRLLDLGKLLPSTPLSRVLAAATVCVLLAALEDATLRRALPSLRLPELLKRSYFSFQYAPITFGLFIGLFLGLV